ncbi:MAG: autotransporter domain-containing protein [Rickettsiales endosymbiont of Dermacentor nuttalli]
MVQLGGLSLGYYQPDFDHKKSQGKNNKVKSIFVSIYGSKGLGKVYLNGSLIGTYSKHNLHREIHVEDAVYQTNSKHTSYLVSTRIELGYNIKDKQQYKLPYLYQQNITIGFNKDIMNTEEIR